MRAALLTPWMVKDYSGDFRAEGGWSLCGWPLKQVFPKTEKASRVRFRVYATNEKGTTRVCFRRDYRVTARGLSKHGEYIVSQTRSVLRSALPEPLCNRVDSGKPLWISVEVKK